MKYTFLIIFFFLSSCISKSSNNHQTDRPHKLIPAPDSFLHISSGSISPYHTVSLNDIPFKLVTGNSADTIFLSTDDPRFQIPEGFRIGQKWKELDPKTRTLILIDPGWGYYIPLKSGWKLFFSESSLSGSKTPADSSRIISIFKRN